MTHDPVSLYIHISKNEGHNILTFSHRVYLSVDIRVHLLNNTFVKSYTRYECRASSIEKILKFVPVHVPKWHDVNDLYRHERQWHFIRFIILFTLTSSLFSQISVWHPKIIKNASGIRSYAYALFSQLRDTPVAFIYTFKDIFWNQVEEGSATV